MNLRAALEDSVTEAGHLLKKLLGLPFNARHKEITGDIELVTDIDVAIHEFLVKRLANVINLPVISEEGKSSIAMERPSNYWLVDPIDGTRSMIEGFSGFATQFSLVIQNEVTNSALYLPATNEMYSATKGDGAYRNGVRMQKLVSSTPIAVIDNEPEPNPALRSLMKLLNLENYIESGSIGVKILRVAEGSASIFVKETRVRDWDVAPAMLVLKECGGFVKTLDLSDYNLYGSSQKPNLLVLGNLTEESRLIVESHCLNRMMSKG